jgi:nitrate reductase gamma subunit
VSLTEVVFSYAPFLALFGFLGAWMYRWGILRNQSPAPAADIAPQSEGALALGFVTLLVGHLTTALALGAMRALLADPGRVAVIEAIGLVGALLFAYGVAARLRRRVQALRAGRPHQGAAVLVLALLLAVCLSGVTLTLSYRWITVWYAYIFVPYLRALVIAEPMSAIAAIAASPFPVKLHALLVMAAAALWPMAGLRLEEIFPLRAVARRYAESDPAAAREAGRAGEVQP